MFATQSETIIYDRTIIGLRDKQKGREFQSLKNNMSEWRPITSMQMGYPGPPVPSPNQPNHDHEFTEKRLKNQNPIQSRYYKANNPTDFKYFEHIIAYLSKKFKSLKICELNNYNVDNLEIQILHLGFSPNKINVSEIDFSKDWLNSQKISIKTLAGRNIELYCLPDRELSNGEYIPCPERFLVITGLPKKIVTGSNREKLVEFFSCYVNFSDQVRKDPTKLQIDHRTEVVQNGNNNNNNNFVRDSNFCHHNSWDSNNIYTGKIRIKVESFKRLPEKKMKFPLSDHSSVYITVSCVGFVKNNVASNEKTSYRQLQKKNNNLDTWNPSTSRLKTQNGKSYKKGPVTVRFSKYNDSLFLDEPPRWSSAYKAAKTRNDQAY